MKTLLQIILIFGLVIGLLCLVASYDSDTKRFMTNRYFEERVEARKEYNIAELFASQRLYTSALEHYKAAYKIFRSDTIAIRLSDCAELLGDHEDALSWLDSLTHPDIVDGFCELKKGIISLHMGDTLQAKHIVDSLISSQVKLKKVSIIRRVWDAFVNDNDCCKLAVNYHKYYLEYYGRLLALNFRMSFSQTLDEIFDIGTNLFMLVDDMEDDYALMRDYSEAHDQMWGYSITYEQNIDRLEDFTRLCFGTAQGVYSVVDNVSAFKWNVFNKLLTLKHINYGLDAAVTYANEITNYNTQNTDASTPFHKFIYEIYLGAIDSNNARSSLTQSEIDSILYQSMDPINGIAPATLTVAYKPELILENDYSSAVQGDKIVGQIAILDCNDWSWRNNSMSFRDYVAANAEVKKELRFIDEFFVPGTSYTDKEKFGLYVETIPYNVYGMNLLQAEYNKQTATNNN